MYAFIMVIILLWVPSVEAEEFYLVSTIGTGTESDPFRAENCPSDAPKIQLGATGKWICRSASLPAKAISIAKTTSGILSVAVKNAASTALGETITATTVGELLKQILADKGILRPEKDGKIKIYFGSPEILYQKTAWVPFEDRGLVADIWNRQKDAAALVYKVYLEPPVALAAALATETFTGTDGDLNGRTFVHAWTEHQGTGWTIVSNQASITSTGQNEAWMGTSIGTADHSVTATLVALEANASLTRCGPTGRNPGTSTRTHYAWVGDANTVAPEYHFYRRVAGTFTSLTTNVQDPVNGDVLQMILSGSTYEGKVNGVTLVGPTTDGSPIATGNYAGIAFNSSAASKNCNIDDLILADLVTNTSAGVLRRREF